MNSLSCCNPAKTKFVPLMTSSAGRCLTAADLENVGISTVAYELSALLLKPGKAFLLELSNLKIYVGWKGSLILDVRMPSEQKDNRYVLRSPYDGSLVQVASEEIEQLILRLQPDVVRVSEELAGYHITDQPASDAYQGILYDAKGTFQIQEPKYAQDFTLIDPVCTCPTCAQNFSRAYLHHLFAQTPLLCQRFLIQHNLYYYQTQFHLGLRSG